VATAAVACSGAFALRALARQAAEEHRRSYRLFSDRLGDTVREMDRTTDAMVLNALEALKEADRRRGVLDDSALLALKKRMGGVTNFYVAAKDGRVLSSDWRLEVSASPELRAKYGATPPLKPLFDFCADYRGLVDGHSSVERTPIIVSGIQKLPYKFLLIPNHDRSRILEADMSMSFVNERLRGVTGPDANVLSVGLFASGGAPLGFVGAQGEKALSLGEVSYEAPIETRGTMTFYTKVAAQQPDCCECRNKGLTAPGERDYYYILRTVVSKAALERRAADARRGLLLVLAPLLAVCLVLAKALSDLLVRRLSWMGARLSEIARRKEHSARLGMDGDDEFSALGRRFDDLMASLELSLARLAEAEREKAFAEVSAQVAHDIRSPLAALDLLVSEARAMPEERRALLRQAATRIRAIADGLLARRRSEGLRERALLELASAVVAEKVVEFGARQGVVVECSGDPDARAVVAATELQRIVSNLVNNAVEALGESGGRVVVRVERADGSSVLTVADTGKGMAAELLERLRARGGSYGKKEGSGLGLSHAQSCAAAWGGTLRIDSAPGTGTTVSLRLPAPVSAS
jgi:signal transduction histidine kinase